MIGRKEPSIPASTDHGHVSGKFPTVFDDKRSLRPEPGTPEIDTRTLEVVVRPRSSTQATPTAPDNR